MALRVDERAGRICLETGAFRLVLGSSEEFRALDWENKLTGRTLHLDGPELALDLDAADRRIWFQGWRCRRGDVAASATDEEAGFRAGYHRADFPDTDWECFDNPVNTASTAEGISVWARSQVCLLPEDKGKPTSFVLGGFGLFDFRRMRVFLNGQLVGTRQTQSFWTPPSVFTMTPHDRVYRQLRWDQPNRVALQLSGQVTRTERLDALDPLGSRRFPSPQVMASPFEQYVVIGEPVRRVRFHRAGMRRAPGEVAVELATDEAPIRAELTYRTDATETVLHRFTTLRNNGDVPLRLMSVSLGAYSTGAAVTPGQQGFPVYAEDAFFFSLAHPSGWTTGQDGAVLMQQNTGRSLMPGERFECMETVLGVAGAGQARESFVAHVRSRSRRVRRGHDRPYAVFENFGSWSENLWLENHRFQNTEADCLHSIRCLAEDRRAGGARFDVFSMEFWVDATGDLERFDPDRFPHGLDRISRELSSLGIAPGLWIDSSMSGWSIGSNPAVQGCFTHNPEYAPRFWRGPFFCRATEPVRTMYKTAFCRHIRNRGVRLLKFDNLRSYCCNTRHDHLPGLYSTEPIHQAVIDALRACDEAGPDGLMFLYWGFRSPWWLVHGDVLFEPGLDIEAASPSGAPTLHARDGVTVGLDQANWWCDDLPRLGKDSLGVWLSDWMWNSSIGAERWQEAFVMDLCRGSLLAQPWSDRNWLAPRERRQMADFIDLLRAAPECFGNPRFILGNPWKGEPYGYSCAAAQRGFITINNCTWQDVAVPLQLDSAWGLPDGVEWQVCRWYPSPARLRLASGPDGKPRLSLRPFEVVLLEVFPSGERPSLDRRLPVSDAPPSFAQPSRQLECSVRAAPLGTAPLLPAQDAVNGSQAVPGQAVLVEGVAPAAPEGAVLALMVELFKGDRRYMQNQPGVQYAATAAVGGRAATALPALKGRGYPAGWQVWRVVVPPSSSPQPWAFTVSLAADSSVAACWKAHWIPAN